MGDLGIRVVRIYTLPPPAFYEELAAYNEQHESAPIYLFQGAYLPDESYIEEGRTLYDEEVDEAFGQELHDISDAVHGDLTREASPGRAGGTLRHRRVAVARRVDHRRRVGPGRGRADRRGARRRAVPPGQYFGAAEDATPTERWIARHMDDLAGWEAARGSSRADGHGQLAHRRPARRHPEEPLARRTWSRRRDERAADRRLAGRDVRELPRSTPTTRTSSATSPTSRTSRGTDGATRTPATSPRCATTSPRDAAAGHRVRGAVLPRQRPLRAAGPGPGRPHRAGGDGHGRRHDADAGGQGHRGWVRLHLGGRVVQADLEHDAPPGPGAPAAVARPAHQRAVVRPGRHRPRPGRGRRCRDRRRREAASSTSTSGRTRRGCTST